MDVSYRQVGAAGNSPVLRRHRRPAGRGERLGHRPQVHPVEHRAPEPTVHDDQQRPLDRIRGEPDVGHLLLIRELDAYGRLALITLLLTVFVNDTFAYVGGRIAGRHKMSPVVSPGKTWEGFVAGAIAGVLTTFIALYKEAVFAETWRALALGAVIVAASTLGDLFESLVKRDLGTKDTGRLLLGHGGVLDRIDSLLFAAPAAYFTILALGQT